MNDAEEVTRRFVIARGDGTVLLESGKKVLDQVAHFVQVPVMAALIPTRFEAGNHLGLARFL